MVWRVVLVVVPMLAGIAHSANFVPLEITADPLWLRYLGGIEAPPGQMPTELSGAVSDENFSAYVEASVSAASDSVTMELSGTAASFKPTGNSIGFTLGQPTEFALQIPESAQSVVQVYADWVLVASSGWSGWARAYCILSHDELGTWSFPVPQTEPTDPTVSGGWVAVAEVPAGEVVRLRCDMVEGGATAIEMIPGPFSASFKLRFRVAQPLPLGDSDADGDADLVDVVVLRRQLAGLPVEW